MSQPQVKGIYRVKINSTDEWIEARWNGNYFEVHGGIMSARGVAKWELVGEEAPSEKSLREIQTEIGKWSKKNFGNNISKATGQALFSTNALLGIIEETGELAHCVLKRHQGIRGYDDDLKYTTERDDAIADILVYLCDFSCREGVDLQEVLNKVWAKVQKRDWEKNQQNAHEVVENEIAPEHREHGNKQS